MTVCSGCGGVRSSSPAHASKRSPRMYKDSALRAGPRSRALNSSSLPGRSSQRCRSEMNRTVMKMEGGWMLKRLFDDLGLLNHDVFYRHIHMAVPCRGRYFLDLLYHFQPFDHTAEHAITPAILGFFAEIEKGIVIGVDEKLRAGGVRFRSTGHGDGAEQIAQAVVCFIADRRARGLFLHVGVKTTTLDHKILNYPVKDGAVIMPGSDISYEILYGIRRLFAVPFQ